MAERGTQASMSARQHAFTNTDSSCKDGERREKDRFNSRLHGSGGEGALQIFFSALVFCFVFVNVLKTKKWGLEWERWIRRKLVLVYEFY